MATVRKMFDLAAAIVFTKYGEDTISTITARFSSRTCW